MSAERPEEREGTPPAAGATEAWEGEEGWVEYTLKPALPPARAPSPPAHPPRSAPGRRLVYWGAAALGALALALALQTWLLAKQRQDLRAAREDLAAERDARLAALEELRRTFVDGVRDLNEGALARERAARAEREEDLAAVERLSLELRGESQASRDDLKSAFAEGLRAIDAESSARDRAGRAEREQDLAATARLAREVHAAVEEARAAQAEARAAQAGGRRELSDLARRVEALAVRSESEQASSQPRLDLEASIRELREELRREAQAREALARELATGRAGAPAGDPAAERSRLWGSTQGRAARGLDELLALLAAGEGERAPAMVERLERDGDLRLFAHDGLEFLRALAACAARFEAWSRSQGAGGRADDAELRAARQALERARALEAAFADEARPLGGFPLPSEETPDRAARARAELRGLDGLLGGAEHAWEEQRRASLEALAGGPPDQDPSALRAHFERFGTSVGSEALDAALLRLLVHVSSDVAVDGRLQASRLARHAVLDRWAQLLLEREDLRASPAWEELLALWDARRWYLSDGPLPPRRVDFTPVRLDQADPHQDWKAAFFLQRALAEDPGAWPMRAGSRHVWRGDHRATGHVLWFVDELVDEAREESGDASWTVARLPFAEGAEATGRVQRVPFARRGSRLFAAGRQVADLRDSSGAVRVAVWSGAGALEPPPRSEFPRAEELRDFSAALERRPAVCLVVRDGEATRWFSPELGLVREELEAKVVRELCFVGPAR